MQKKKVAILGSTGSIGTQTLDVIASYSQLYEVYALTANNQVDLLIAQARRFQPEIVVIANEKHYPKLSEALADLPIKVYTGQQAICQVVQEDPIDIVVAALVGYAGLESTIHAIRAKKRIALANKETLVVAGQLIRQLTQKYSARIIPVDSEHSAIYQCCMGENSDLEKIILTASGGPFRTFTLDQLRTVTKEQALNHPNWQMGAKVTIDSASMMNKGFELIEAKWLFYEAAAKLEVIVHPESIVHSMVQFKDGSVKAQLGVPDMRLPIQFALSCPDRLPSNFERLDFAKIATLTFEKPDTSRFRNLALAIDAMDKGGNLPCILNAANEIAVDAFLHDKITFLGMSDLIDRSMQRVAFLADPQYEDYVSTDLETRRIATELLQTHSF
ncbi:MAG: 1-deoxy-D-xylulose-5-phosphate reductoisomerase [Bacteroidaceae bacterium]|nr:1-deoxy-D-xylulose-5-phosphate reductoisomerase [Bacteroidaceae bacterium]MBP9637298.1 1-deoxy-D-xylulose-5-phosphate reductoisomerase [Bacteroidaceae bacterium]